MQSLKYTIILIVCLLCAGPVSGIPLHDPAATATADTAPGDAFAPDVVDAFEANNTYETAATIGYQAPLKLRQVASGAGRGVLRGVGRGRIVPRGPVPGRDDPPV